MRISVASISTLLLALASLHGADSDPKTMTGAADAFRQLKTLAGEWQADTEMGKARVSYELIAGGTALVEHERSEKMPDMLTVYTLDGGRLILTHYCAAGNQPRMQAEPFSPAAREIQFRFLDATNLTPGTGHMHNVSLCFIDDDHLASEWQFYENGQLKFTEKARYTRVR